MFSFAFGVAGTYYFLGSKLTASNQLSNQFILKSELRYLELLEEGKSDALEKILKMSVDCQASTVKQFIDNGYWSNNLITEELIERSEKYYDKSNNCHGDIFKVIN